MMYTQRVVHLHQHVLVLWVFTVIRFLAQLLHLCHQAPVANDLQQAGLQGDAQPGNTQGAGLDILTKKYRSTNAAGRPVWAQPSAT